MSSPIRATWRWWAGPCWWAGLAVALQTASGGQEGQAKLTTLCPSPAGVPAVLLDLTMPRMDGRKLLAWARAQPDLRDLVSSAVTCWPASRERSACLARAATDFWVKPSDLDAYIALIGQPQVHLTR